MTTLGVEQPDADVSRPAEGTGTTPHRGARAFVRGVATLSGGRLVGAGLAAVWLVIAARELSVTAFGDLSVLLSIGLIGGVIGDLGFPFLLSHEVARTGRIGRATLRYVVTCRLYVGVGVAAAAALFYELVARDRSLVIPMLYGVSLLTTVVYSSISASLRGLHVYRVEALNEAISRMFVLAVGAVWLHAGGGLVAAVAVYALADTGSLVALLAIARRRLCTGDDGIDIDALRLRNNAHLTGARILATVYYRADSWLMAALRGPADAALYAAPYRLLDGLLLLPRAVGAVAVPQLRVDVGWPQARKMLLGTAAVTAMLVWPIVLFASPIVRLLFGARYASSGPVLAVLACSAVPGSVVLAALPLAGLCAPKGTARIMGCALVAGVVLDLLVIPQYGPLGAAVVTLACQSALVVPLARLLGDRRRPGGGLR